MLIVNMHLTSVCAAWSLELVFPWLPRAQVDAKTSS